MPWNKDGGGGGGKGPWGQGPWGQGPWGQGPWGQGPKKPQGGGRGPTPPDLDELIRRVQDRLKSILPGGFGLVPVIVVVAAVFWLFQSVYTVQPNEQGIVLRFGKYDRTTNPGLHFIVWPVETVETAKTLTEQKMDFGISGVSNDPDAEGLIVYITRKG